MIHARSILFLVITSSLLVALPVIEKDGRMDSGDEARAVFVVRWYDVGKSALEGLKGVNKVERGFRGFREVNTVYYDPGVITIEEMEMALKRAGTYLETVSAVRE
jgi:hypothetical protein